MKTPDSTDSRPVHVCRRIPRTNGMCIFILNDATNMLEICKLFSQRRGIYPALVILNTRLKCRFFYSLQSSAQKTVNNAPSCVIVRNLGHDVDVYFIHFFTRVTVIGILKCGSLLRMFNNKNNTNKCLMYT